MTGKPPTPAQRTPRGDRVLLDHGPLDAFRAGHVPRRLAQLVVGLALYGASLAFLVRGALGVAPWDVLHTGVADRTGWSLGSVVVAASFVVLLLWIPLRERPGLGTLANAFLVGISADVTLALFEEPQSWVLRIGLLVLGLVGNALATALYIGAQFGRGPRDGLMTGLVRRTGWSLRLVRTGLEVIVVLIGLALGGALGLGTVLYALLIGPMTQLLLPFFLVPDRRTGPPVPGDSGGVRPHGDVTDH